MIHQFIVGNSSTVYLLTANDKVSALYAFNLNSGCRKINEAPFSAALNPRLSISPDETQGLVQGQTSDAPLWDNIFKSEVYWVPLNGQSIVRITTPDLNGTATDPKFTPDSKFVMYMARPLFVPTSRLFLWKVPKLRY